MNSDKELGEPYIGPISLWLTGLPCSGKTTIAKRLDEVLKGRDYSIAHLDGDDLRMGLNGDLGFSEEDRRENHRRVGYVAQLFNEKGMNVLASFISPLKENRDSLRSIIKNFNLVYVKCSVEECSRRDVKGMYAKAERGELEGFTGVSAPYEEPQDADIVLDTEIRDLDSCVDQIIEKYFFNP